MPSSIYNAAVEQPAIRPATPENVDALLALERQAPTAAHWSRAQYEAIFQPGAISRLCLVAGGGEVQGFLVARTEGPEWELENLVVAPGARRRGLGTQLVRALRERARQQHARAIWLEVRASNTAARCLYQGCGFTLTGVRPHYYRDPQEDAILFTCDPE